MVMGGRGQLEFMRVSVCNLWRHSKHLKCDFINLPCIHVNYLYMQILISLILQVYIVTVPGVSILQENLNYSPALSVICQILPQLQSYSCLLTKGIDASLTFFVMLLFLRHMAKCPLGCTGGCLRGDLPPSEAGKLILKLESCNLMNTFGHKFRE